MTKRTFTLILVALLVLKFLRSREVNELQPWNMSLMVVTLLVLNLVTSREVNELQ